MLIENIVKEFELSVKQMRRMKIALGKEMDSGLSGRKSSLPMLPAYCDAATGTEKGMFLALDLGGTNFRVMMVRLAGKDRKASVVAEAKYKLTGNQITGNGSVLFDAIARYVGKFLHDNRFSGNYSLGYTFSFPVKLLGIDEGILMRWTKEFTAKGVVGRKIVDLQKKAFARQGVDQAEIVALANDTVGTLQTQAVLDPRCQAGVILGTGFNICVQLPTRRIRKDIGSYNGGHMIVNMEAGAFNRALPFNRFDRQMDRESENPGGQLAEKMISGKYQPQLFQLAVSGLIKEGMLFGGRMPKVLKDGDAFTTREMGILEAGSPAELKKLGKALAGRPLSKEERCMLAGISHAIARRSARISATMIAGALTRVERRSASGVTVAVDGSLFEKYPGYCAMMQDALRELEGRSADKIRLKLTKDGSGIGAAVIAAVVSSGR